MKLTVIPFVEQCEDCLWHKVDYYSATKTVAEVIIHRCRFAHKEIFTDEYFLAPFIPSWCPLPDKPDKE
jgi:hypothetical protein